jgi:hypothetical protein
MRAAARARCRFAVTVEEIIGLQCVRQCAGQSAAASNGAPSPWQAKPDETANAHIVATAVGILIGPALIEGAIKIDNTGRPQMPRQPVLRPARQTWS